VVTALADLFMWWHLELDMLAVRWPMPREEGGDAMGRYDGRFFCARSFVGLPIVVLVRLGSAERDPPAVG
jgi:hypothetical protein